MATHSISGGHLNLGWLVACIDSALVPTPAVNDPPAAASPATPDAQTCVAPAWSPRTLSESGFCPQFGHRAIETPTLRWELPPNASDGFCGPPVVARTIDTDGDGALTLLDDPVVYLGVDGQLTAVTDGGVIRWVGGGLGAGDGLAIADADGDGTAELYKNSASTVSVVDAATGSLLWGVEKEDFEYLVGGAPSVVDLDGDGLAEVIAGREVFDHLGARRFLGEYGAGITRPWQDGFGASIDGVGAPDVLAGNTAYSGTGAVTWSADAADGHAAVADLDLDGSAEVVLTTAYEVLAIDAAGNTIWGPVAVSRAELGDAGAPAVGDVDADGFPEVVVSAGGQVHVFDHDGQLAWTAPMDDESGAAGPTLVDFNGDGALDIAFRGHATLSSWDGFGTQWVSQEAYDGDTRRDGATGMEHPVLVDLDHDGAAEWLDTRCDGDLPVYGPNLRVWSAEGWGPGAPSWTQYAYTDTLADPFGRLPREFVPHHLAGNTFRGTLAGSPAGCDDATLRTVHTCEDACDDGSWTVFVEAGNAGRVPMVRTPVAVIADGAVLTTERVTVPPGETRLVRLTMSAPTTTTVEVVLDHDERGVSILQDVDPTNNSVRLPVPDSCQAPAGR